MKFGSSPFSSGKAELLLEAAIEDREVASNVQQYNRSHQLDARDARAAAHERSWANGWPLSMVMYVISIKFH